MKHLFTLILFIISTNLIFSQLATFEFPATSSLVVSSNDGNVTVSNMSLSSGAIETNITSGTYFPNEPYIEESAGWNQSTQASAKYFQFTITANPGYTFNITNISFNAYSTAAGPSAFGFAVGSTDLYEVDAPNASLISVNQAVSGQTGLTTATIRIQGWLNGSRTSSGAGAFRLDDVVITGSVVLPIELSSFDAKTFKNTSILSFTTASETNNDFFTIERSADGSSFDAIGEIKGAGNSNTTLSYEFTDEKPFAGVNYYRIKQTDYDGKFSYTYIKYVRHNTYGNLSITPRTTEGRLQITTDAEDYTLDVYNVAGQQVKSYQSLSLDQSISIDELTAGLYYIKVNVDGQVETTKIVKL